jgi:hypothetical protein
MRAGAQKEKRTPAIRVASHLEVPAHTITRQQHRHGRVNIAEQVMEALPVQVEPGFQRHLGQQEIVGLHASLIVPQPADAHPGHQPQVVVQIGRLKQVPGHVHLGELQLDELLGPVGVNVQVAEGEAEADVHEHVVAHGLAEEGGDAHQRRSAGVAKIVGEQNA